MLCLMLNDVGTKSARNRNPEDVMSVCGWNDTMAAGLKLFAEGLAVQTEKRAIEDNIPVSQVPSVEIPELKALLDSMSYSEKCHRELEGIFAITMLAHFLYRRMHEAGVANASAKDMLVNASREVSSLFAEIEEHNVQNLRPRYPYREAMWRLARYLDDRV